MRDGLAWGLRHGGLGEAEADEVVFASEVESGVREDRGGPAWVCQGRYLPAPEFLAAFRCGSKKSQETALSERDETAIRMD